MHLSRHLRTPRGAAAALAVAAGTLALAGCGSVGYLESGNTTNGKTVFTQKCGSCHVLEDAGSAGTIGPNLDASFFQYRSEIDDDDQAEDTIRQVVRGQISYPIVDTSTGAPGMPADIVEGQEADDVAAYVARVAGTGETADTSGGGGGGDAGTDGKSVFSANCAACHTLADAGASGAVGPNLDQSKPSKELTVDRVTNGQGAMPPFKDTLSDEQIDAVAAYVADVAG